MENKSFCEVVKIVYKKLGAAVFAIEFTFGEKIVIRLNPADFILNNIEKNEISLYFICLDYSIAEGAEYLEITIDE